MNKLLTFLLLGALLVPTSIDAQLIRNPERLKDIERMLEVQKNLTAKGKTDIWSYLKKDMPSDEKQALRFLYAYMPLSDMADYSPTFMDMNVQYSLKSRAEMPWGKTIPEEVFLHFVLPLRINNENLDSFRKVMYNELKDRVKGLSMKDAALEVNHWCHEKVTYRGTDIRTSAPLSTVKKSFGRCGEESTFTVTALRTVGIPARQVYTPRWAHSDDNHAWVEVWIDGKWYFMGACEPDPELNMGWFAEPATRAMLVHTRAYGHYYGNELAVTIADRFSELNLTSHYAPVKKVFVEVKDQNGHLANNAKIQFGLYNYAEYYPIATQFTNQQGLADLTTGYGDLLVWASLNGKFGYAKLSVSTTDTLHLTLDKTSLNDHVDDYYMVPPKVGKVETNATPAEVANNSKRLMEEDSIRHIYMATFKDASWAAQLANKLNLDEDKVKNAIAKSYGNWDQLQEYLENGNKINSKYVLALLDNISDKDFSDTQAAILLSHLSSAVSSMKSYSPYTDDVFEKYVLSPRLQNEILTAWRPALQDGFGVSFAEKTRKNIAVLTNWIVQNITVDSIANMHSRTPLSPAGVFRLKVADEQSRDLFFVAACRSFGIAARIDQATNEPQYMKDGKWLTVFFSHSVKKQMPKGKLHLVNGDNVLEPQYYLHFTIGKLQDGSYKTLEFDEEKKLSQFPDKIELEEGYYVLVTGNRQSDGSVLSSLTYFKIGADSLTNVKVELVKQPDGLKASAKLDLTKLGMIPSGSDKTVSLADVTKGVQTVLVVIDPDKEPSKHIMNDLAPYKDALGKTNTQFVFVCTPQKAAGLKILETYSLPEKYIAGIDVGDNILSKIMQEYGETMKEKLPLVLYLDPSGNVYYFSAGYRIGAGEQLLRTIVQAEKELPCNTAKQSCVTP